VSATIPLIKAPPPGNYFVTLVAAEYTGTNPGTDDGYVADSSYAYTKLATVRSDGTIVPSDVTLPSLSVASTSTMEGNSGTTATFTVPVIGNTYFEPDRAFGIELSNAKGATIAPAATVPVGTSNEDSATSAWGVIHDDDAAAGAAAGAVIPTDEWFPYH